jgi:predicted nucleic acid-binding protein
LRSYVDSSVLLRVVLGEEAPLGEWSRITQPVASELIRVECLRTIDRARLRFGLPDHDVAERRAQVLEYLEAFELVTLDRAVLERTAEPFPTAIGTLDAIHLTSALVARSMDPQLNFATHDAELGLAARAMGFSVVGVALPARATVAPPGPLP